MTFPPSGLHPVAHRLYYTTTPKTSLCTELPIQRTPPKTTTQKKQPPKEMIRIRRTPSKVPDKTFIYKIARQRKFERERQEIRKKVERVITPRPMRQWAKEIKVDNPPDKTQEGKRK